MENATAIRLFIVLLFVVSIAAGYFQQPLIMLGGLFLVIVASAASFKILVKADAKKLAEKNVKFNKFPDTMLKEGAGGLAIYLIILFVLIAFFTALINLAINKPLLDRIETSATLAAIFTLFRYYTYKQYKKIKK